MAAFVISGLGPIGLMLCACVADAGGRPVGVGSRAERRALAPSFGAETAEGRGADVVIEAAGTIEASELHDLFLFTATTNGLVEVRESASPSDFTASKPSRTS